MAAAVAGEPVEAVRGTIEPLRRGLAGAALRAVGRLSATDRLIGHGGLNFVPEFDETEVLWALHPDAWGQGYATEVARAALAYGFETLGLDLIFAITLPDNLASQAVMKRLGLTYRRRVDYRGFTDIVWFDIDREAWQCRLTESRRVPVAGIVASARRRGAMDRGIARRQHRAVGVACRARLPCQSVIRPPAPLMTGTRAAKS